MAPSSSSSRSDPPAAEETRRNWLDLPEDVTAMILHKVGGMKVLTIAKKVCTTWRKICRSPAIWRSIDLRFLGVVYDHENLAIQAIDRSHGQAVRIKIEFFGSDYLLRYISNRASQLRHLELQCCQNISSEGLSEAAKKLPLLEELHICCSSINKEALTTIGHSCPLLRSFKLDKNGSPLSQLQESDEEAQAIAENMHQLRYLKLVGDKMTNNGLMAILDGCSHLESLDLRQCHNLELGGDLGKSLSERIKDLQLPCDSTEGYGFHYPIYDEDSLFSEEDMYLFPDIDVVSYDYDDDDDDDDDDDGDESYLIDYDELF